MARISKGTRKEIGTGVLRQTYKLNIFEMCAKKPLCLLLILFVSCFQSCSKKSLESHGGLLITARFSDTNLTDQEKRETLDLIEKRLADVSKNDPVITLNQSDFTIEVPEAFDVDLYKYQIGLKGDFEIAKVFTLPDIYNDLVLIDSLVSEKRLLKILSLTLNDMNEPNDEPIIGLVLTADTAQVISILTSEEAKKILPESINFKWDLLPLAGNSVLYAINGNPLLNLSNMEVKSSSDWATIHTKKEFIDQWAEITEAQKDKYLGVFVDQYVFRSPRVGNKIENGLVIDDFMINRYWTLLSPVFKYGKIPHDLEITDIKLIEKK